MMWKLSVRHDVEVLSIYQLCSRGRWWYNEFDQRGVGGASRGSCHPGRAARRLDMGKLRILASGKSPQAQAQARGKLFEQLMAEVLRVHGFRIDNKPNVNYAGMEIDIEGRNVLSDIPLYAECKCYDTEIDAPKFQAFCGKYVTRWLKDARCQGLFIALPGVNSHVKGFYRDNYEKLDNMTIKLLEEEQVLEAIFGRETVVGPEAIATAIPSDMGSPGDWLLLYTDEGLFWVQYVIPPGAGIPRRVALFDVKGSLLSDRGTVEYLTGLEPELNEFERIEAGERPRPTQREEEEIVEVRGSSARFEYQFPASPQYFVGREGALAEIDSFVAQVISRETSSRGLLFEAYSGWGKSSLVLATAARLQAAGHVVVAIDSRSASSSQFVLRAVDYALRNALDPSTDAQYRTIGGFEDAVAALISEGRRLERSGKILLVFFDQFENIFLLPETLKRIRDTFLKLSDAQTNVLLGFSWKTDLVGLTSEFPYRTRDDISATSKHIVLHTFSEVETNDLLDKLASELHSKLRKDLRFFLSEFSQGYPWLLTKLCAHVKAQREAGVLQADIANNLLNVEQLFQEDLSDLSAEEDDTLRRVAKAAPIGVSDLGEEFKPQLIQSLVHRRLLVRIGNKYDIYWDIFRDYLNSGRVPVQENYILRMQPGSVLRAVRLLAEMGGSLTVPDFRRRADVTTKSFYNVARDMRLLGFAKTEDGAVRLQLSLPTGTEEFEDAVRNHLLERLRRNRLIQRLMETLESDGTLKAGQMADLIASSCPYISATGDTWNLYGRIFAGWMDRADLATYDAHDRTLSQYLPGREVRERRSLLVRRRDRLLIPCIQYKPIERALSRIYEAMTEPRARRIDWSGFAKTTRSKSLTALEDLGFIERVKRVFRLNPEDIRAFVEQPDKRPALFAKRALNMPPFATFVEILQAYGDTGAPLPQLGAELKARLGVQWQNSTAETNAKIMLDWARHAGLAPAAFAHRRMRSSKRVASRVSPLQRSLWDSSET